jgi:hypothetical protein
MVETLRASRYSANTNVAAGISCVIEVAANSAAATTTHASSTSDASHARPGPVGAIHASGSQKTTAIAAATPMCPSARPARYSMRLRSRDSSSSVTRSWPSRSWLASTWSPITKIAAKRQPAARNAVCTRAPSVIVSDRAKTLASSAAVASPSTSQGSRVRRASSQAMPAMATMRPRADAILGLFDVMPEA